MCDCVRACVHAKECMYVFCAVYGFRKLYSKNILGQIIPIVAHNHIIASITRIVNIL